MHAAHGAPFSTRGKHVIFTLTLAYCSLYQLLKLIGAFGNDNGKNKHQQARTSYQDSVMASLDRIFNNDAVDQDDGNNNNNNDNEQDINAGEEMMFREVLSAVQKVYVVVVILSIMMLT